MTSLSWFSVGCSNFFSCTFSLFYYFDGSTLSRNQWAQQLKEFTAFSKDQSSRFPLSKISSIIFPWSLANIADHVDEFIASLIPPKMEWSASQKMCTLPLLSFQSATSGTNTQKDVKKPSLPRWTLTVMVGLIIVWRTNFLAWISAIVSQELWCGPAGQLVTGA